MYYNDHRVRAGERSNFIVTIDEKTMIATVEFGDTTGTIHCEYEVCDTCNGKGRHVNPSIDAHGLSREDFDEDPDFREDYFSGMYDVECYECRGKRVVPVLAPLGEDEKALYGEYMEWVRDEEEFAAISRAERAMGA